MTPAAAVALAGGLALAGRALGWLALDGALAAAPVGALVLWGGGVDGAVLLGCFFVSSSVLTYALGIPAWIEPAELRGRTARQVLANGGWAAAGAALLLTGRAEGWGIIAGSLAAAQADTWATEIGARAAAPPRLLTTGRPVPPGTSGGVTPLGTLGGVAGAAAMGGVAGALGLGLDVAVAGAAAGTLGMLGDSLLGATVQAVYRCPACARETERRTHGCGTTAHPVRGVAWLGNNAVNLAASGMGALTALGIVALW